MRGEMRWQNSYAIRGADSGPCCLGLPPAYAALAGRRLRDSDPARASQIDGTLSCVTVLAVDSVARRPAMLLVVLPHHGQVADLVEDRVEVTRRKEAISSSASRIRLESATGGASARRFRLHPEVAARAAYRAAN